MLKWGLVYFLLAFASGVLGVTDTNTATAIIAQLLFFGNVVLFVVFSSIGVWSAVVMSRIGKGTPLPLDHASDLVVVGPYKYVRNPMAVSGIGQGLAVAFSFA